MATHRIPATLEAVETVLDSIESQAAECGFDRLGVSRIRLACEEILVNVVHYAYPAGGGDMAVSAERSGERPGISITVEDRGRAFDPLARLPPGALDKPLSERPIGGLGIHLVMSVMDGLCYRREDGKNILTMIKFV